MKTKTKINKQISRKTNQAIIETIKNSKKHDNWMKIASILSGPRRNKMIMNLRKIDQDSKDGESVLIPGKVLSQGEINKKIKIIAKEFSEKAQEKLSKSKIEFLKIGDEIKKNPKFEGVRILTNAKK